MFGGMSRPRGKKDWLSSRIIGTVKTFGTFGIGKNKHKIATKKLINKIIVLICPINSPKKIPATKAINAYKNILDREGNSCNFMQTALLLT